MNKVIVGFDASEQSDDALVLGQALAKVYGAELHVAIVLPRTRIPFEEAIAGRTGLRPAGGAPLRVRRAPAGERRVRSGEPRW